MIIGIDLGTTNSLVSVWADGKAQLIPNALGHYMTPSVVALDQNDEIVVGLAAREMLLTNPASAAATFKRYMGSNKTISIGSKEFRAEELSSLLLRSLKEDAEAYLGEKVTEAIITVPAYFNEPQRKATRIAGQLAGFNVERLLNEPTAAALAYGLHSTNTERKFLVFDLGGGTFDVSILELFDDVMEVRASAGDNYLGGENWIDELVKAFMIEVGHPAGIKDKHVTGDLAASLRNQAERAKRKLSTETTAQMSVMWKQKAVNWEVSQTQLEKISVDLLKRIHVPVERALRDARIRASELDEIVLVGGATRKPMIRKMVARMFGRLPSSNINPDEVVAMGAAVQAGLKARDATLNEIVVTDVCPYTLGIEVSKEVGSHHQSGFYEPIIERNSTIPVSRVQSFSPVADYQTEVSIKVYQGESPMVKDNILLESLHLPIPSKKANQESFDVRFTYDINGLLEVEATVESTGLVKNMIIEENPGSMDKKEIAERFKALAQLKIHPREMTENKAVMARAERIYEEYTGEVREFVRDCIIEFMQVLERQDNAEIATAREKFEQILTDIDGTSYL